MWLYWGDFWCGTMIEFLLMNLMIELGSNKKVGIVLIRCPQGGQLVHRNQNIPCEAGDGAVHGELVVGKYFPGNGIRSSRGFGGAFWGQLEGVK